MAKKQDICPTHEGQSPLVLSCFILRVLHLELRLYFIDEAFYAHLFTLQK